MRRAGYRSGIANVMNQPATVTVTIGNVEMTPFNLAAGASTRLSFAGEDRKHRKQRPHRGYRFRAFPCRAGTCFFMF